MASNATLPALAMAAAVEGSILGAYALGVARSVLRDRRAVEAARRALLDRAEPILERVAIHLGSAAYDALAEVIRQAASHLSQLALDLAPLVIVDVPRSLPATALAFHLYGDPERAQELVGLNGVSTPLFMPTRVIAYAPGRDLS